MRTMARCSPTRSRWIAHELQIRSCAHPGDRRHGGDGDAGARQRDARPDGPKPVWWSAPECRTAGRRHRRMAFDKAIGILPRMSSTIRAAKSDGSAVWTLLAISFAYGIFHAAGPGHGKA